MDILIFYYYLFTEVFTLLKSLSRLGIVIIFKANFGEIKILFKDFK